MHRMATTVGCKIFVHSSIPILLVVFLGILSCTEVLGEEREIETLTLDKALQIAAEKNHDIQKAREYKNQVEAIYVTERAAALPQVMITAHAANAKDESQKAFGPNFPMRSDTRSAEIGLSQALFTWGQVGAAIRAAKVGIATADDQLRIFRQAAFRDVSASFFDVLLAKELHAIALQNAEQKVRHFDETQKKYISGVASDYDVLSGKVDVENARPVVIRTENLIRISREKIRFLLGMNQKEADVEGTLNTEVSPYPSYEEAEQTPNPSG